MEGLVRDSGFAETTVSGSTCGADGSGVGVGVGVDCANPSVTQEVRANI